MEPPFTVRGRLESAKSVRLLREDDLRIEGNEPRRYVRLGHDALANVAAAWRAEREEKERLEEEEEHRARAGFREGLAAAPQRAGGGAWATMEPHRPWKPRCRKLRPRSGAGRWRRHRCG